MENVNQLLEQLGIGDGFSNVLLIWALLMGRIMPIVILAPFLGGDLVPAQVKMGIGLALTLITYPLVSGTVLPAGAIYFVLLLIKEVLVGAIIAYLSSLAFEAARAAGTFADTVSGSNMATVFVPQIGQQATLFASFNFQLSIVLFLLLNGHHVVLQALFTSFEAIPLTGFPNLPGELFFMVVRATAQLVAVAVALAAPAVVVTFMVDLSLGLINRIAPQIQVFFISMALKPMLVTAMLAVSLLVIYERVGDVFRETLARVLDAVGLMS